MLAKPAGQECGNCRYFSTTEAPSPQSAWCLRYPPWVITGSREFGDWPVTKAEWWCGEWKQATAQE